MDIKIVKTVHQSIANVIKTYGFTGDIMVNLLYEKAINDDYIGVYYFVYEDELYHIIAVYADELVISLNNEIAKVKVK